MDNLTYYDILGISRQFTPEEIKQAFRRLALIHHPDHNANSDESKARFIQIRHAYENLIDEKKRREYDLYLKTSSIFGRTGPGGKTSALLKGPPPLPSAAGVAEQLNYLLWDLEDFLTRHRAMDWTKQAGGHAYNWYMQLILVFLDHWVLTPAGFPDYYLQARQIRPPSQAGYYRQLWAQILGGEAGHRAFMNIQDYFYSLRKRMDRFLNSIRASDLMLTVPEAGITLAECVLEAQALMVHTLGGLNEALKNPDYRYEPYHFRHEIFGN